MYKPISVLFVLLSGFSGLVGCTPPAQPDPAAPQAEVVTLPTATPEPSPVPTEPPTTALTATAASVDWTTTASVEGDYYVLGNP